jgi:hypothetical protein
MDLKLGIGPKVGNFLSGKREGEERETEIEGRYREIPREIDGRNRKIEGRDMEIDGRNRKIEGRDMEIDGINRKIVR